MSRPTSWADDTPETPIDDRLLLELMGHAANQAHDRDDTGSLGRAHVRFHSDAAINAHFDRLAGLGP